MASKAIVPWDVWVRIPPAAWQPGEPRVPLALPVIGGGVIISLMALAAHLGGFWAGIAAGGVLTLTLLVYIPTARAERRRKRRAVAKAEPETR